MTRDGWCCTRDGCISMSRSDHQLGPLMDLGRERPQVPARARNMSPIVPRASIAGRALVAVVAIMTFLASITTGAVLLVSASAAEWQSEVATEITIQVRPTPGRDIDRDAAAVAEAIRGQSGIVEIRPFTREEIRQAAGALARQRTLARRSAGSARDSRAGATGNHARSGGAAPPGDPGDALGQRRRSPCLDRADAVDDRRHRDRRHRDPGAGDCRDHHFGVVRDTRCDGGESPDRRSPALRGRGGSLYRQPLPAAFSSARSGRRGHRLRHRHAPLRVLRNRSPAGFRALPWGTSSSHCWGHFRCALRAIWRWRRRRC